MSYTNRLTKLIQSSNVESVTEMFSTWGLVPARDTHPNLGSPISHIGVFTHMFLHGGFMHLMGNMIVLWAFGYSLEGSYGSRALLSLYLIWGACAATAHVLTNLGDEMPMIGASGAIAGLIGAYTLTFGYNTSIKTMFFDRIATSLCRHTRKHFWKYLDPFANRQRVYGRRRCGLVCTHWWFRRWICDDGVPSQANKICSH